MVSAPDTDVDRLLRANYAITAERNALRAIIEGRTTPPTDAEIAAHRLWRATPTGNAPTDAMGARYAAAIRDSGGARRWWPIDEEGRPCAWPSATTEGA